MGMFVKVMAALLLTLPLGAYIAGTLAASQVDMPDQRTPVVVDAGPSDDASTPGTSRSPRPSPTATSSQSDDDHSGHGRGGDDHGDDDDIRVVRPTPRDLDDVQDEREDRAEDLADERQDRAEDLADEKEDHSGSGGGGDDRDDDD